MTIDEELRAWNQVAVAVLDRDIATGKVSADPTDIELETPLAAAVHDAREAVERIASTGGHWQGRWVPPRRPRRTR